MRMWTEASTDKETALTNNIGNLSSIYVSKTTSQPVLTHSGIWEYLSDMNVKKGSPCPANRGPPVSVNQVSMSKAFASLSPGEPCHRGHHRSSTYS